MTVSAIINELSVLVSDADLHVAHLALTLGKTITQSKRGGLANPLRDILLPRALALLPSSLLQGIALRSLLAFLGQLVAEQLPLLSFDALMAKLLALPQSATLSRHSLAALSQAVAACCAKASSAQASAAVQNFASQLSGDGAVLALLCIGEIGRLIDLSSNTTLLPTIIGGFDAPDEEKRSAASFAFGNIAAGNLSAFVPDLLAQARTCRPVWLLILSPHLGRKAHFPLLLWSIVILNTVSLSLWCVPCLIVVGGLVGGVGRWPKLTGTSTLRCMLSKR